MRRLKPDDIPYDLRDRIAQRQAWIAEYLENPKTKRQHIQVEYLDMRKHLEECPMQPCMECHALGRSICPTCASLAINNETIVAWCEEFLSYCDERAKDE